METKLRKKDIARALGVSASLVSRYVQRGMPVYSIDAAMNWYEREIRPRVKPAPPGDQPDLWSYDQARARREYWAAQREEMTAREQAGELLQASAFVSCMAEVGAVARAALEVLPLSVAPRLVGRSESEIVATLRDVVDGALNSIADRIDQRLSLVQEDGSVQERAG